MTFLPSATNVSRAQLRRLACEAYELDRDSSILDKQNVDVLNNSLTHCDDQRSFAAYGPLAKPIGDREARDTAIEWFAHTIAHFAPLRYLGSALFTPTCVYFEPTLLATAIDNYVAQGCPEDGYQVPSFNDFNRIDSIARLHEDLGLGGVVRGPGLESIAGWFRLAFILHSSSHWSVVIYMRSPGSRSMLIHYDSLPGLHAERALQLAAMLRAAGLIDPQQQLSRTTQAVQPGTWQCGYAVMARLYEEAKGHVNFSADAVIENRTGSEMRDFLRFIKHRNEQATTLSVLAFRWKRIHQAKNE
jgi:hypothetical protein